MNYKKYLSEAEVWAIEAGLPPPPPSGDLYKLCPRCKDYWPLDREFFIFHGGYSSWCKACHAEAKEAYYQKNQTAPEDNPAIKKRCTCCQTEFPLTHEYFYYAGPHFQSYCKECHKKKSALDKKKKRQSKQQASQFL